MSFNFARFPLLHCRDGAHRPILWVMMENAHGDGSGLVLPALIDTGADSTVVPRHFCEKTGHVYDAGDKGPEMIGVGAGTVRTFRHSARFTVLSTPRSVSYVDRKSRLFDTLDLTVNCVDNARLKYVLLGRSDFLVLFEYVHHQRMGWFALRRTGENTPSFGGFASNGV